MRAVAKTLTVTAAAAAILTLGSMTVTGVRAQAEAKAPTAKTAATTKLEHPKKLVAGKTKGSKYLVRVTVRNPSDTFSDMTTVAVSDPSGLHNYKILKKSIHKTGDSDLFTVLVEVTLPLRSTKKEMLLDIGTGLMILTTTVPDATTDPMLVIPDPVYDPCDGC